MADQKKIDEVIINRACPVGCKGNITQAPHPETPDELLTEEKTLREILRNMFAEYAWRVVNGERLDRDFNIYEQYSMVLDDFADEAIKKFKAQLAKVHQSEAAIRADYEKKIKKLELKIKESTEFKDNVFLYMNQVAIPRAEGESAADEREKTLKEVRKALGLTENQKSILDELMEGN